MMGRLIETIPVIALHINQLLNVYNEEEDRYETWAVRGILNGNPDEIEVKLVKYAGNEFISSDWWIFNVEDTFENIVL